MTIRSVAVIFDNTLRPETTGFYCRRALEQVVQVRHFLPSELDRIPPRAFDLYLNVDDGLDYRIPAHLHPCAWWAIDTHMDFARCLAKARDAEFVFAAQRDGAERLREEGVASAAWLPLACDPEVHRKHGAAKTIDVCFVGNVFPGEREDLLQLLQKTFPNTFVGQRYFEEMARTYTASRIVFNRSIRNDINMRVFETLACGSLLLTNDLADNGQEELFRAGVHLATYREPQELLEKARYYLARDEERERIAAAGREEALARHTYRQRMETLLAAVAKACRASPHATAAAASGPRNGDTSNQATSAQAPVNGQSVCAADPRDSSYFDFARPELLALVPESARQVLDIGCGAGRLGAALKARQPAEVTGIEFDERAARMARQRLDQVLAGDAEEMAPAFEPGSFDVIVCGDVLEHLREPGRLLRRARDWLRPGGRLIASIPNVRHHSVVRSLLEGNWTYEAAGLLDGTHLRFFTRRTVEDLFHLAGFRVSRMGAVPGPGYEQWEQQGRPGEVRAGRLHIGGLSREEAEEFYVYQYLVTAEPARPARQGHLAPADATGSTPPGTTGKQTLAGEGRPSGPMQFTQDFIRDFEQFDFFGPPFAFLRYGDGERAICMGKPVVARDGWAYPGGPSRFADDLNAALCFAAPDYYLGISDGCCDLPARDWYLQQVMVPLEQVTFANIFVNWNYRRFRQLDLRGAVTVSSGNGDFSVPENFFGCAFDIDALVERLLEVDRPILVAAGPASAVIIHKYWQRARRKQAIVDVGSAIDEWIKGHKTRPYQHPGTRTAELICHW